MSQLNPRENSKIEINFRVCFLRNGLPSVNTIKNFETYEAAIDRAIKLPRINTSKFPESCNCIFAIIDPWISNRETKKVNPDNPLMPIIFFNVLEIAIIVKIKPESFKRGRSSRAESSINNGSGNDFLEIKKSIRKEVSIGIINIIKSE